MHGHATYHFHVTQRLGGEAKSVVHINRTCWTAQGHRTSQGVFSLPLGDFTIDVGSPLDQAIACAEAALAALEVLREELAETGEDHA